MEGMWSLIFFTLLVQASSGMVLWQSLLGGKKAQEQQCWSRAALALAMLGMVFSLLHLSAPLHSVFTINNIFFSWLSREIASVGLFVALLFAYIYTKHVLLLYASAASALVLSYAMSKIYTVSLVPYWQNICVFGYFLSSALVLGALLLWAGSFFCPQATTKENMQNTMKSWMPVALGFALVARIGFGVEQSMQHIPRMSSFALHAAPTLLALALAVLLLLQRHHLCAGHDTHKAHKSAGLYTLYALVLCCFIVAAEVLGRLSFYQGYTWFGM